MATEYSNIYADNNSISTDNSTIDGENVACVFTETPVCTDTDRRAQSVSTSNLSNYRNFNYAQSVYYTVSKSLADDASSTVDYEYSRLFAKILDVFFIHKNSSILTDEQLKLLLKLNDASDNIFAMPLDVKRLDQFLGAFREY
jgi:hypothetical protein